ncbi:TrmH family RNA methyltransferase [Hoeflea poritis]|uniref:RNA methyltransferase n=1 Tax=Hoeflea poritis TaxID=2993659 RepID=A0ABT4VT46_9HYPH|nr:RNA methyltransferase [Hoeflea poritis]MDA4847881.1 RNA methyltransferase [Hoeflea poritis]
MSNPADRLIRITDAKDERIADFRNIRERDLVGRSGRFIAEGTVVLRMLARSRRFGAEKILVLENRVSGIEHILEAFDPDTPIMVCDRKVIDAIAGFPMHRGVLAIGRSDPPQDIAQALAGLKDDALVLVCSGISNHDNMGGLFRNAAAFGVDLICLDGQCCDPLYRKSIRVSVGAALTVPYARGGGIGEMADTLDGAGFQLLALSPKGVRAIDDVKPKRRTALVVGTEGEGLPESLLKRIDTARIPQAPGLDSLNVGTAAAIALFSIASALGRVR